MNPRKMKSESMRITLNFSRSRIASAILLLAMPMVACADPRPAGLPTTAPSDAAIQNDPQSGAHTDLPPVPGQSSDAESLKQLIGVSSSGLKRVDLPKLPSMTLCGYVLPRDGHPRALLQIADLNRIFLVEEGTEIPVTVQGRLSPIGRSELVGLSQTVAAPLANDANAQSQIILKVKHVSAEGVTVEAGLIDQTIIVR